CGCARRNEPSTAIAGRRFDMGRKETRGALRPGLRGACEALPEIPTIPTIQNAGHPVGETAGSRLWPVQSVPATAPEFLGVRCQETLLDGHAVHAQRAL